MAQDLDRLEALERKIESNKREIQEIRRNATDSPNTTQYEITENTTKDIRKVLEKTRRYRSVDHFVDESIANTVKFWNQPEEMMVIAHEIWPDLPKETKLQIKKNAPFLLECSSRRRIAPNT